MEVSAHFKEAIKTYLDNRAVTDELFATSHAKTTKNLNDCITFILNYIYKSKLNGLTDSEVYSLAVHYFDENELDIGNPIACHVVVNHVVELTDQEIEEAQKNALRRAEKEAYDKMMKIKNRVITKPLVDVEQKTLFDL